MCNMNCLKENKIIAHLQDLSKPTARGAGRTHAGTHPDGRQDLPGTPRHRDLEPAPARRAGRRLAADGLRPLRDRRRSGGGLLQVAAAAPWPAEATASPRRLRRAAEGAVPELRGLWRAAAQPHEQALLGPSARRGQRAAPQPLDRRGGRGSARPGGRTAPARRHGRLRLLDADGVALADGHLRLHPEGGRAGRVLDDRCAGRCLETRSFGPRRRATTPSRPSKASRKERKR